MEGSKVLNCSTLKNLTNLSKLLKMSYHCPKGDYWTMTQECLITQFSNISASELSSPTQHTITLPTLRIFRARCRHRLVAKSCQEVCWSKIMFSEIAAYSPTMREKILIVPSSTICENVAESVHFNEDLLALEELQLPGRQGLGDDEVELLEGSYLLAVKNWTYCGTCDISKRSFEILTDRRSVLTAPVPVHTLKFWYFSTTGDAGRWLFHRR